jgi:hypothetical protein
MSAWHGLFPRPFVYRVYLQWNLILAALLTLLLLSSGCGGISTSQSFKKTALTIATGSPTNGTVGVPYSSSLSATGGAPPYIWAIGSGNLPSGLSLNSLGKISGTPSATGPTSFTVKVTDTSNNSASAQLTLMVNPSGLALSVGTSSLPTGTIGVAYSSSLSVVGGTPPYVWAISTGSLPNGLSLSSVGEIAGTPFTAGSANFTVQVTDATNNSANAQLALTIESPATDTATIFEVDGIAQTDRPVTLGRVFRRSEIAQCPQPVIGGARVSNYQSDVKNRWPDGSVKFAIVSFAQALPANSATEVSFQNTSTCNNTGYLMQSQMVGFNAGNWGAQIVVTPAGEAAVTSDAKTMLAASDPGSNTFGDCKNDYWLQGPVVTAVVLQDCTSSSAYDFGWTWNGNTMTSPVTGNASTATFHPQFICYFYPGITAVQCEMVMEMPWAGRVQDQLADLNFETADSGGTLHSRWSRTGARELTDIVVSGYSTRSPHNGAGNSPRVTINAASATANFTSRDVGSPFCLQVSSTWYCGTIIRLVNSSNVTVLLASDQTGALSGSSLTAYVDLQYAFSRHRKIFWSGTANGGPPGHIRIDHNFPYLISTKAILNYDLTISGAYPDHGYAASGKCCGSWAYSDWANTDRGDIGGQNGWDQSYSNVVEGAPLQRNDLLYLYNMSVDCGTPNGRCAKAWDMLTGEVDANASTSLIGVAGGGGDWFNMGNVPFHMRESRTVASGGNQSGRNCFYVSQFENKNVAGNATLNSGSSSCLGGGDGNVSDPSGPNNATGKALSRHAHSQDQFGGTTSTMPIPPVGTVFIEPGGWGLQEAYYHWLDFAYLPYLLTGSPYYLEEEYFSASYQLDATNSIANSNSTSNRIFAYANPGGSCLRCLAWTLQSAGHAAYIAPDGSAEASYYAAMVNSNLEVQEGAMGLTGTTLTPSTTNCSGASCAYNAFAANRWDWGRATVISQCTQTSTSMCTTIPAALHEMQSGSCPITPAPDVDLPASAYGANFQYSELSVVLSHLQEMGLPSVAVGNEAIRFYLDRILDSTYNPYLIGTAWLGVKVGTSSCVNGQNTDPFISSYATLLSATASTTRLAANFDTASFPDWGQYPCGDHGYSLEARAATSFGQEFNVSSTDAKCPGGVCTASVAWTWVSAEVPYFNITPTTSTACSVIDSTYTTQTDEQIKFALVPR